MKPLQDNTNRGQEGLLSAREEKKRIAIQSNSGLFFQVGLIISMLLMLWIVQQDWELMARPITDSTVRSILDDTPMVAYTVEKPPVEIVQKKSEPVKRKVAPQKQVSSLVAIKNSDPRTSSTIMPAEPKDDPLPQLGGAVPTKTEGPTNVLQVEEVPVFPGCDRLQGKKERLECFQDKIQKFVGRKFRADEFVDRYAGQRKQIHVMFTIDEKGQVTDIQAVSRNAEDLAAEAIRVIHAMPILVPGKQNGIPVKVSYQLPITLQMNY